MDLDSKTIGVAIISEYIFLILLPFTVLMAALYARYSGKELSFPQYVLVLLAPSLPNLVWQVYPTTSSMNGLVRSIVGSSLADTLANSGIVPLSDAAVYLVLYLIVAFFTYLVVKRGPAEATIMALIVTAVVFFVLPR